MNGKYTDYCLSTPGGEHQIISPPQLFIGILHLYISTLPGVMHFRAIMATLNRTQVPNKDRFGKQLAEYNRWYHCCQAHPQFESSGGFKGTSFSVTRARDINWFPKLLVKLFPPQSYEIIAIC